MWRRLLFIFFAFFSNFCAGRRIYSSRQLLFQERYLESNNASPVRNQSDIITDLPGLSRSSKLLHHSGIIQLKTGASDQIFYWHVPASQHSETAPLVIWLNGGPGCSSMEGAFFGISPLYLRKDGKLHPNEHSWYHTANLLFVDQPVGTGMSRSRNNVYRSTEEALAEDFYDFLCQFFTLHSEYLSISADKLYKSVTRPVYIFGESHAGRYIPQFSEHIIRQNESPKKDAIKIDLRGVGIGNGWVHPRVQYEYSEFAHGIGLITLGQVRQLKALYQMCLADMNSSFYSAACLDNLEAIVHSVSNINSDRMRINTYDIRMYVHGSNHDYPPGIVDLESFLSRKDVREAFHVESNIPFELCSNRVHSALLKYDGVSTLHNVEYLLDHGIKVLFYNGQWDMVCNPYNTEAFLIQLNWSNVDQFHKAEKFTWSISGRGEPAGFVQHGGNLTYLVIPGAGHMVTHDVPAVAFEMVKRFINDLGFEDKVQDLAGLQTRQADIDSSHCPSFDDVLIAQRMGIGFGLARALSVWTVLAISFLCALVSSLITLGCVRRQRTQNSHTLLGVEEEEEEGETEESTSMRPQLDAS